MVGATNKRAWKAACKNASAILLAAAHPLASFGREREELAIGWRTTSVFLFAGTTMRNWPAEVAVRRRRRYINIYNRISVILGQN